LNCFRRELAKYQMIFLHGLRIAVRTPASNASLNRIDLGQRRYLVIGMATAMDFLLRLFVASLFEE
jgi:hypothetical protein